MNGSVQKVMDNSVTRQLVISNKRGLHARASAKFVQMVEVFDAVVEVEKDSQTVGGNSIMGLMMLAASQGSSITVTANGKDAEKVLDALQKLVEEKFGEES
ncbi:HPr family phosphocarrier protein [uncultured Bartonella sp.]|uniref:HPr family phosphocarrier protein n=1 Tax=uncultured Bartonella sp. TaxID=104108 RepID=UPI0025F58BC7|nr:HPr family phosphocarrier protein [uncultured Bartonella sp.]